MELQTKLSLIEQLCKSISFQVRWLTRKEEQRRRIKQAPDEDDERVTICRLLNLSKQVMDYIDVNLASKLPSEKLDEIIRGSLLGLYRLPSVAKKFETETLGFYDWWGHHIRTWSHDSRPLVRRHLKAMIAETKELLRSENINSSNYKLKRHTSGNKVRHYSARRLSYSKVPPLGRALGSCLSDYASFPSPITSHHGNALWFLKELETEGESKQPPRIHDIEYVYIMPRCYGVSKRKRKSTSCSETISSALERLVDRYEKEEIRETSIRFSSSLVLVVLLGGDELPMCKKRKRK